MKKVEINVYNFNELDSKIKENLVKKEIEEQTNLYCEYFLKDDMEEKSRILLEKYFKNNANFINVFYDLSYSQGSGAMIEFDLLYNKKHCEIKNYGHYCHKRSFEINSNVDLTDKEFGRLNKKIISMNEELEKFGYKAIENCISKEEAIEILEDHNYFSNGEIFE